MDGHLGKKAARGHGFYSKGRSIACRDQNYEDRRVQDCNRLGCSTSLNSMKGTQIGDLEKAKYVKPSFRSTSSKTIAGNSSKSLSSYSSYQKSFHERLKQTLQQEKAIAESSNSQGNIEDSDCNNVQRFIEELDIKSQEIKDSACSESNPTKVGIQTLLPDSEELELPIFEQVSTNTSDSSGSCTIASSSKSHEQINHHFGSGNRAVSSKSFFQHSTCASRNSGNAASPVLQSLGIWAHRCGLKSLICTSVSDALPSGHSSSGFSCNRRIDAVTKRPSGGENSAAKGEGTGGPLTGRHSDSTHTGISGLSLSLPAHLMHQQTLLHIRTRHTSGDDAVSVRNHQASTVDARTRLSEQGVGNILPVHEPVMISYSEADPESSPRSSSTGLPNILLNSSGSPGSSCRAARNRMVSRLEDSSAHILHGSSGDRDSYRHFNEELLLALERIEQGEELTHEQLSVLETNLFSGGQRFCDRHRDMRMDIDNMSYEELLALEEKMGTVNTGLSEDQLSECLERTIYTPSEVSGITGSGDDTKCSICQEVYVSGDEVGKLACEHRYHVACIDQWLGLKNWCPICKASSIPS